MRMMPNILNNKINQDVLPLADNKHVQHVCIIPWMLILDLGNSSLKVPGQPSYLKLHFMLIKYRCDSKLQTLHMRYPFLSTGRPISHRSMWLFCIYMIPLRDFIPEWNSHPGTTPGMNSCRGDKHYTCATRSCLPADRFHTEACGCFAYTWYRCEISYQSEILTPVQQPGWTHAGVTHAGMTFCGGIM